ncbi:hypothetical protein AB1N83_012364 [Pleurotus pulmonarius]
MNTKTFPSNFYAVIGHILQILLFGFLVAQISRYREGFPNERFALKAIAWSSFLISFALTILDVYEIALAILYSEPNDLSLNRVADAISLLNGFVMSVSQLFFAWRIGQLSQKMWLQIFISIVSVLQWGGSLAQAVAIVNIGTVSSSLTNSVLTISFYVWMAGNIVCDLTITLSMIWFLWKAQGEARFKPTRTMLARILTFTLETGLITTVWMALQLIPWGSLGQGDGNHQAAYSMFLYPSGTLYTVWLLATLNSRSTFNQDLPSFVDMSNLPTIPGEIRFKHPTIEGTEFVVSVTTNNNGAASPSHGGSLSSAQEGTLAKGGAGTG